MALVQQSSPHAHRARPTSRVMLWVIIAAVPGLLAQTVFFGWGNLINVVWCIALALATEAAILKMAEQAHRVFPERQHRGRNRPAAGPVAAAICTLVGFCGGGF